MKSSAEKDVTEHPVKSEGADFELPMDSHSTAYPVAFELKPSEVLAEPPQATTQLSDPALIPQTETEPEVVLRNRRKIRILPGGLDEDVNESGKFLESDIEEEQFPSTEPTTSPSPSRTRHPSIFENQREKPRQGFFEFFWAELSRGYALEKDEERYTEKRNKVYAFMNIPKELEKFLLFGFLQCADAFLYFFTFLPLRFIVGVFRMLLSPLIGSRASSSQICDILKVIVLVVTTIWMQFVDTSFMYHLVRGQAVIKLYIFFNMLEVADRLFSSFGQDILDALFWTATEPRARIIPTILHLLLAILYVMLHTLLVLFQATTLNVAFNSHNKALLTIMLSNNFVELKGSVFKKFAKSNLFQMACADVRERFHYLVLLFIVIVRNMTAVNWKMEHLWEMCPDLAMVLLGEFLVDWVKHAFITKFNEIPYEVYKDFTITIAYDVSKSRQSDAFSDYSDQVSRRMGFIPLPLTVLLVRILSQSIKIESKAGWILLVLAFLALLTTKILNSIILLGKAAKHIQTYEGMQAQADLLERLRTKKARSLPASPRLSLVEFKDIMQQSHPPIKGFTVSDVLQHAAEIVRVQKIEEEQEKAANKRLSRSKSVSALPGTKRRAGSASRVESTLSSIHEGDSESFSTDNTNGNGLLSLGVGDNEDTNSKESPGGQSGSPTKRRTKIESECESLQDVDRYTLLNNDRIVA